MCDSFHPCERMDSIKGGCRMINVMLVDDEVLALEYLKNIMEWEEHGYCIVGCVTSAKKALELCEKTMPQIVISDIRMPGMDGLELAKRMKEKNPDIVVVLLSAYKDFEYAKKGIVYGVSNYLLKHELCEETLLDELERIRGQIERDGKRKKIYQKYFMNQLIYNQAAMDEMGEAKLGNRLFLVMIHKRNGVVDGEFIEEEWTAKEAETMAEVLESDLDNKIFYAADAQITSNNRIVLYRIENTPSKSTVNGLIEQKSTQIGSRLSAIPECRFNVIYSYEITPGEISSTFRAMSKQIRHAVFWKLNKCYPLCRYPDEEKTALGENMKELQRALYSTHENPAEMVREMLENLWEENKIENFKSVMTFLNNLIREVQEKEKVNAKISGKKNYTTEEVIRSYEAVFHTLHREVCDRQNTNYSKLVSDMVRYIRQNYQKELSLDVLGEKFQMNGVYLGQVFKKEVGVTFLKYLTNIRMEEAKRLLIEENCTVAQTASLVGYQTSQYFSHIFAKNVGKTPQEYKNKAWKEKN